MCKELPPATAGLSGTTRRKARLNRSTPCARRRGGGYRTEPIPFACSDERGCHLPTSQRSRSITQIKAGPFCQGSDRFQFPGLVAHRIDLYGATVCPHSSLLGIHRDDDIGGSAENFRWAQTSCHTC